MDNQCEEHISDALRIADDLMKLANEEVELSDDADETGFVILFGVIRDYADKIRHQAER